MKISFSCVCMNVLQQQVNKKALCFHECSNSSGECQHLINLPVFTAVIKLSAFADAFVEQSAKQFCVGICARS